MACPSLRPNSYFLHAPVNAVTVGAQWICLAVGNRVLVGSADGGSDSEFQVVTELPYGAVITALEQHVVNNVNCRAGVILVIGSGDSVFVLNPPLWEWRGGDHHLTQLVLEDMARVLRIRSLGPGAGVLVITAISSAYIIQEERLSWMRASGEAPFLVRYAATGLGVALAADAVLEGDGDGMTVFTGTYAGSIAVWRLPVADAQKQKNEEETETTRGALIPLSWINAHHQGCAVFAVKAITLKDRMEAGSVHFCVATCSDDRTATLYTSDSINSLANMREGLKWTCCWRGAGTSFSRRRVFDVSMYFTAENDGTLFFATGSEDGSVHVFAFHSREVLNAASRKNLKEITKKNVVSSVTVGQRLLHRGHQHDGRGVYKVALLRNPTSNTIAVVSCGFDGAVHYTPLSPHASRRGTIVAQNEKPKRHVRGVVCDDVGNLLACTEDELIIFPLNPKGKERRLSIPIADAKKDMPSCIKVAAGSFWKGRQQYFLALIGTTGGNIYGMWYNLTGTQPQLQEGEEEKELAKIFVLLHASSSRRSKVLFVQGKHWQERVLIASIHADGNLLLLEAHPLHERASEVRMTRHCAGVHTTGLSICIFASPIEDDEKKHQITPPEQQKQKQQQGYQRTRLLYFGIFVGDDEGGLSLDLVRIKDYAYTATTLLFREPLFREPIACVIRETRHINSPFERITVLSTQGEWRVVMVHVEGQCVDIVPVSCPLRLPWRISSVLACTETVAVTMFGTDISVYRRHLSRFGWHLAEEYHGVRAPRLLSATIPIDISGVSDIPVFVCHCSDGVQAEWFACDSLSETRILSGGAIIGREYNTALFLPSPAFAVICGSENSMLTVLLTPHSPRMGMDAPLTITGPHDSNILAMAVCITNGDGNRVRFVTVGGLATLALWEWSTYHNWRVVAHVSQQHECTSAFPAATDNETEGRGVPRFLSVCTTLEEIVVGGSDGILRVFSSNDSLRLLCEARFPTSTPKPMMAVATLNANNRLVVVGDTSGTVGVCNVTDGSFTTHLTWAKSAVNAIAVGRRIGFQSQKQEEQQQRDEQKREEGEKGRGVEDAFAVWRVLAAMDSGDVVLLHVGVSAIGVICVVRVGLTAACGVSWITGSTNDDTDDDAAVVVNGERLTYLQTCGVETAAGRTEMLRVSWHTRVNVRGVSGLAVASSTRRSTCAVVVGEGVEAIPLCADCNNT
ncbi:hypothetical protein MOQ_007190 [Trypanosoma cruzi marinkellei]|uniref:Uncharacterized protein n=1 Tax=Trypanosoma cruzi marinkellei TaxID=85056 RepID=K2MPM5_TRYCR|nr:hypothetical protein MOQ_007190 [Trypanosoma cruzi marinkellei]